MTTTTTDAYPKVSDEIPRIRNRPEHDDDGDSLFCCCVVPLARRLPERLPTTSFFFLFFFSVIFWAQGSRHGETLGTGTGTGSEKKLLSGGFLCCHDDQGVQGLVCCCVSQWQLYGQYLYWWQERTSLYEARRMNRIELSFGDTQCLICMCECEMSAGCQNSHGVSCFPRQELTPIALWRLAWRGGGGKQGQTHIIRCRQNRGKVEGEST